MDTNKVDQDKLTRTLRWVARIWSILIIGIAVLIFLGEILFPHTEGPVPLFEYLIPFTLFISVLGLAIAWRWELIGGAIAVIFAFLNLAGYILTGRTAIAVVALILSPIVIPGILFLICGLRSHQIQPTSSA